MPAAAIKMQPTEASSSCLPAGAPHILVVDDDREMCEMVQVALGQRGYSATWRLTPDDALAELEVTEYSALLVDVHMQGKSGLDLCRHALTKRPEMPVIVMTGFGTMNDAVGAIRAGAYDFVTKPASMDALALTLERAIQHRSLTKELRRLRSRVETQELPSAFGASDAMQRVSELISRVAESDTSVLITGESGTGKELVARALHERSHRAGPFLAINCAAVPETLLESELFGYVRGAFTDARADRAGLFVEANGGTLFLDEIGEMPLSMQTKLLRALQERKVRPVGSSREVPFSARIVTATNRDLEAEVAAKRFREDLFYRVNVVRVDVPPLRERGGDPLELAQLFLSRAAKRTSRDSLRIDPAAAQLLLTYDWPGNVRELENCMERAVALARLDVITVADLPTKIRDHRSTELFDVGAAPADLPNMSVVEERYIRKVLAAVGGNKTRAAVVLGFDRRTLTRKLKQLS
ncbi:MAG TPA: sigma-54 dependent transcriptional regulator [Polyangiaceae bacterium]|nr:sigma-54 dependent transcriptional regulator [Polyangiaceae bacterium]